VKTTALELARIHREGSESKQERSTFDYLIDGESLEIRRTWRRSPATATPTWPATG
jgi:hypothetical protein